MSGGNANQQMELLRQVDEILPDILANLENLMEVIRSLHSISSRNVVALPPSGAARFKRAVEAMDPDEIRAAAKEIVLKLTLILAALPED